MLLMLQIAAPGNALPSKKKRKFRFYYPDSILSMGFAGDKFLLCLLSCFSFLRGIEGTKVCLM